MIQWFNVNELFKAVVSKSWGQDPNVGHKTPSGGSTNDLQKSEIM